MPKMSHALWMGVLLVCPMGLLSPVLAASGRTPGTFSVSPTGAATYTLPIWAPPGPRSLQPHIALSYDSNAGNGPVGAGWYLSGLSSIERCNKTVAQDGVGAPITLTASDVFCLDGNRLRRTGGTYGAAGSTYQTEIANFSNVTAVGQVGSGGTGPASFTVQGADGLTYTYGSGGNSAVTPASGVTTILAWMLSKVTDRAGNTMTISYAPPGSNLAGATVPQTISWTPISHGSSSYSYTMKFTYATNQYQSSIYRYITGHLTLNASLLSNITIANAAGTTIKRYAFTYLPAPTTGRLRLTQVKECADTAQTDCLSPTAIAYQPGTAGVASSSTSIQSSSAGTVRAQYDLNGDGRPDLLYFVGSTWYAALSNGTGYGAPINTGVPDLGATFGDLLGKGSDGILANNGGTWWYYQWNGTAFSGQTTGLSHDSTAHQYVLADITGDGLADLVTLYFGSVTTRKNTSTSGVPSFASTATTAYTFSTLQVSDYSIQANSGLQSGSLKYLDFNGDGLKDVGLQIVTDTSSGAGPPPPVPGIVYHNYELLSNGAGTTFTLVTLPSGQSRSTVLYVNWNSDACTDAVLNRTVYISGCDGSLPTQFVVTPDVVGTMDWDGDGRTDLLVQNGTTLGVYLSTGVGIGATMITTSIPYNATGNYFTFDVKGDGLDDLGYHSGTSPWPVSYWAHNGAGSPPDLLSSITDGWTISASPIYTSIAQNNYTKYSNAAYPNEDYVGPLYVVSSATLSDGTGGTFTNTFWYYGAQVNSQGRGFNGFDAQRMVDSRNSTYRYHYFERVFPDRGMVYRDDWVQSNNTTLISHVANTDTYLTLDSTANNQRYFPYASATTAQEYEVAGAKNGLLITTTATTYPVPDNYGNFGTVTRTVTDNDAGSPYLNQQWTTSVINTIAPNAANWCLNLPTQTTVTKSSTTAPSITRTVGYTPDYANCRLTQQVVEPGGGTYTVTEDLLYDLFGNVKSDKITGHNMTARTTLTDWGATGQFPMTVTNALSQITQLGYDFDLGVQTSITDPNGIQTTWDQDTFARQIKETRPDGTYTTTDYSACNASNSWCGTSNSLTDLKMESYFKNYGVGGALINQRYASSDGYGRARYKKHTDLAGAWTIEQTIYDSLGRVSQQSVPYQSTAYYNTFFYDVANRLTQAKRPISASNSTLQTTTTSYQGRTIVITDPQGKTTTRILQVSGNLGRSKDHDGYYQDFAYDAFGSLLSVKDSSAPVNTLFSATYDYGLGAFQRTTSDIDRGAWSFTYDALGELTDYSDAKSQNFSYSPYDPLGRPTTRTEPDLTTTWTWGNTAANHNIGALQSVTATGGSTYTEAYAFDSAGRLTQLKVTPSPIGAQDFDLSYDSTTGLLATLTYPISTSAYRLKLQYGYANGYLQTIKDFNALTTVFWTANTVNAMGELTQETLGTTPTAVVVNRSIDAVTGWMSSNQAGVGGGTGLLNQSYLFDLVGNVTQRQNNALGLTESACYDNVYRLDHTTATGVCTGATSLQMAYDAMGNIASRSDVNAGATWTYDPVHKHQVKTAGAGNSYSYDLNGNMTTRNGNAISWTSYNYPLTINATGEASTFDYGPDHQYWRQSYSGPSGSETTYYLGKLLERVIVAGVTDYRHYIMANGEPIAIYSRTSAGTNTLRYALEDHQGSFSAVLTSAGTNYVSESFAPFGARRNPTTWSGAPTPGDLTLINAATRTGYTGQAMLGSMGLIHMNGRVQDSITGRILSADPYVTEPENTQDFNRYGYADNNPLTYIDPSGYTGECTDNKDKGDQPTEPCEVILITATPPPTAQPNLDPQATPPGASGTTDPSKGKYGPQSQKPGCQRGTSVGNWFIDRGKVTATIGSAVSVTGGMIIDVGAIGAGTVVFAPEGVAAMGTGAVVAGFGGGTALVGVGMQGLGGLVNWGWGGGWRSAASAGFQVLGAEANSLLGKRFPNLPDVLGYSNPIDKTADSMSDRISGASTCP